MRKILIVALVLVCTGCYHATVMTGPAPVGHKVSEWKHSFIVGLVPMSTTDAGAICKDRPVALVDPTALRPGARLDPDRRHLHALASDGDVWAAAAAEGLAGSPCAALGALLGAVRNPSA